MAYLASILICMFVGPWCMWIPFVCDGCYEIRGNQGATVIVQQQQIMMQQQ
jgi:hypothetical protein